MKKGSLANNMQTFRILHSPTIPKLSPKTEIARITVTNFNAQDYTDTTVDGATNVIAGSWRNPDDNTNCDIVDTIPMDSL